MLPIDEDTLQAVRALWLATAGLPALFDRPAQAGRLKADRDRARPLPYAQVSCEFADRRLVGTKPTSGTAARYWYDVRKVTLTLWGTKAQVVEAASVVLAAFNLDTTLSYPSGSRFMYWRPVNEFALTQDETGREGQDIWRGTLEARVQSVRTT